jgi:hypothetical protein
MNNKEQPTSTSIENMAEEEVKRLDDLTANEGKLTHVQEKLSRFWFTKGYKANNSLLEIEKWVYENKYYFSGSAEIELLNKIQELKTKQ